MHKGGKTKLFYFMFLVLLYVIIEGHREGVSKQYKYNSLKFTLVMCDIQDMKHEYTINQKKVHC